MKTIDFIRLLPTDLDGVNIRELAHQNYDAKFCPSRYKPLDFETAL